MHNFDVRVRGYIDDRAMLRFVDHYSDVSVRSVFRKVEDVVNVQLGQDDSEGTIEVVLFAIKDYYNETHRWFDIRTEVIDA